MPVVADEIRHETGLETGPETGPKIGPETGPKIGPETGPKIGPETGPKIGPEIGPEIDSPSVEASVEDKVFQTDPLMQASLESLAERRNQLEEEGYSAYEAELKAAEADAVTLAIRKDFDSRSATILEVSLCKIPHAHLILLLILCYLFIYKLNHFIF
jgi:hypothetical protein